MGCPAQREDGGDGEDALVVVFEGVHCDGCVVSVSDSR